MANYSPTLQGVVPVTYVQLLYDYLRDQGHNAEAILGPAPIAEKGLGRFPVRQWFQHLSKAAETLNDPMLGLHLGSTITPKHMGVLGYVLLACGTLGLALQRLQQYHQLIYDVNPMQIELHGSQLHLIWGQEMGRPGALVDETAISSLIQFCRDITDMPNYSPLSVAFVNPTPDNIDDYQEWFGCSVIFEQAETRVVVDSQVLNMPLRRADPALIEILALQADALLEELPQTTSEPLSNTVRQHIAHQLHKGEPNVETLAAELNITSRTLHRRLSAEGAVFRELLQQIRHQLAKDYLQDPRLQLVEIAQLLGYSEQSAFSRAFKTWQGQSPKQYRTNQ